MDSEVGAPFRGASSAAPATAQLSRGLAVEGIPPPRAANIAMWANGGKLIKFPAVGASELKYDWVLTIGSPS
jgi:hypothetical protein